MKVQAEVLEVNGVKYVPESSVQQNAESVDGMECVIVRTYSAGVHMGYLSDRNGKEVTLKQSRRLWYWDGAATLSQLAVDGTSKPASCKFPCTVPSITLLEAIEIIPVSAKAKKSIEEVKIWKQ